MRISRAAIAAPLLALTAACAAQLTAPDRAEVRVAGQTVTVAAPPGLCIDPRSLEIGRAGAFMLIGDCVVLGGRETGAAPVNGILTATVSTGGVPGSLDELEAFLTGPGAGMLGKSGRRDAVRALESRQDGGVLFVKVEDRGPSPVPGAAPRFWRAFFEVSGRLVSASLVGFDGAELPDGRARGLLAALATATRAANPAPAVEG